MANPLANSFSASQNALSSTQPAFPSTVDNDDDGEGSRVVETDPTGRFERYAVCLGRGAYKEVYKAFDQEEGQEVAWNQLRLEDFQRKETSRILSEIEILQTLRNEHIINLFHHWTCKKDGKDQIYFITELMTSGTLKSYVRKTKGLIKPKILKNWARQILLGLLYLHTRDPIIIHRDLKCDNVFINGNNGQAKIGDLGHATFKNKDHVSSVLGTPEFMAPELYDEKYDERVDIYAFGMVLLEICTKEYPYSECTNQAQIYKKVTSGIKPAALEKVTEEETRKFIELCIEYNPLDRPSARELLDHPFMSLANINATGTSDANMDPMSMSFTMGEKLERSDTVNSEVISTISSSMSIGASLGLEEQKEETILTSKQITQVIESDNHTYQIVKSPHVFTNSSTTLLVTTTSETTTTLLLKMTYATPTRRHQEITFPFNLAEDTATDVVNEMVNENLLEAKDEQIARRRIEEIVREVLIRTRSSSGKLSDDILDTNLKEIVRSRAASQCEPTMMSSAELSSDIPMQSKRSMSASYPMEHVDRQSLSSMSCNSSAGEMAILPEFRNKSGHERSDSDISTSSTTSANKLVEDILKDGLDNPYMQQAAPPSFTTPPIWPKPEQITSPTLQLTEKVIDPAIQKRLEELQEANIQGFNVSSQKDHKRVDNLGSARIPITLQITNPPIISLPETRSASWMDNTVPNMPVTLDFPPDLKREGDRVGTATPLLDDLLS